MSSSATTATGPDDNSALYLIPISTFSAIALVLVILRLWTRLARTRKMYADDWLILIAGVVSFTGFCIAAAAIGSGWGRRYATFTSKELITTLKLQFALQTAWVVSLCLVRISVACSLLRFGIDKPWRITLYSIITLQALISSSFLVIQFAQCTPVSAIWESVPDVKCWDTRPIVAYSWVIAGIYVSIDLILSLMPIRLIQTLSRPTSEKILIGVLMAFGLLATTVACVKMTTFNDYGKGDPMQATIKPSMYAKLEELVGIIASCLPCLKSPAEHCLRKFGFLKEHELSRPSFVYSAPLSAFHEEPDRRSSSEGSMPMKSGMRVDTVSMIPGSAGSYGRATPGRDSQGWDAV